MKNFSLRTKLFLLSSFLLTVSMAIGVVGYLSLHTVDKVYSEVSETNVPNLVSSYEMILSYRRAQVNMLQVAMPGSNLEGSKDYINNIRTAFSDYEKSKKDYLSKDFAVGEEAIFSKLESAIDKSKEDFETAIELFVKSEEGAVDKAAFYTFVNDVVVGSEVEIYTAGKDLSDYHLLATNKSADTAAAVTAQGDLWSILSLVIGGLAGMLFAFFFSQNLVKTLRHISEAIGEASSQVAAGSNQIASSSEDLSQATTEQASSLEETAASIEEMSSMVTKNTENARSSAAISRQSHDSAAKGRESVEQMILSMDEINKSNEQIAEIVRVINEIDSKTKVINDIVFQTKLLSFNASVEAARAGEHGKGFAVVAEEVGNLAQMSGNAAKEISSLLESSIQKVEIIVHDIKIKVESGTVTARQCGEVLGVIVKNVSELSKMAEEVSIASDEQSHGVQEITKAMNQLDQVTQTNAATSEECASAAEELSAQADALKSLVLELSSTVNGASGSSKVKKTEKVAVEPTAVPAVETEVVSSLEEAAEENAKVVHLKSATAETSEIKLASGDDTIPSYDDPRFKDV